MICEEEVKRWLNIFQKSSEESESSERDRRALDSLDDLVSFLNQLKEFIEKKGHPRAVLHEIPSVGKLLGMLAQNYIMQCSEEAVKIVFHCIMSLASAGNAADSATRKTISWAQSQIRHMVSPSPMCPSSVLLIGQYIGNTATETTQIMIEKVVDSICYDLMKHDGTKWSTPANDVVPSLKHQGLTLWTLSEMCVPLVSKPVVKPLVESLLVAGNATTDLICSSSDYQMVDCLSPRFLSSVTELTRQKAINFTIKGFGVKHTLSYQSLTNLWRRYQPSFENQIFDLVEAVVLRYPDASNNDVKIVIETIYLARACRDYEELFLVAIQIVYSFGRSSPQNTRLTLLLNLLKESIARSSVAVEIAQ
ncbi:Fanconi anemia group C protein homolog [Actinia tenebrosa]|uniref:Fanconi anemia group C protein homolog n=1 Tax=Actinia tenebrosa TaxID=6105 RepID=A0A6P8IAR6_ACTTE|nr:Fanconi anemia group C protein homolog [Actinia tenebrosa]